MRRRKYLYYVTVGFLPALLALAFILGQAWLERSVERRLEAILGEPVRLESLDITLSGQLSMTGLSMSWLQLDRLRIDHSLWHLVQGNWQTAGIQAQGLVIRPALRPSTAPAATSQDTPLTLPAACRIHGVRLVWASAADSLELWADSLALIRAPTATFFHLTAGTLHLRHAGAQMDSFQVSAHVMPKAGGVALDSIQVTGPGQKITGRGVLAANSHMDLLVTGALGQWATLAGLEAPAGEGRLALSARYTSAWEATAALSLGPTILAGVHIDTAVAAVQYAAQTLHLDSLALGIGPGRLVAHGQLADADHPWDLALDLHNLQPAVVLQDSFLAGQLNGRLTLSGQGTDPKAVAASGTLDWTGSRAGPTVLQLTISNGRLQANLESTAATLHLEGEMDANGIHTLQGEGQVGTWSALGLPQASGQAQIRFTSNGAWQRPRVEIQVTGHTITWEQIRLGNITGTVQIDSSRAFTARLKNDRGLSLSAEGQGMHLEHGHLALEETPLTQHLLEANDWSGRVGLEATASGTVNQPLLQGTARVRNLRRGTRYLGDSEGQLSLDGKTLDFTLAALDSHALLAGQVTLEGEGDFTLKGQLQQADLGAFLQLVSGSEYAYEGHFTGDLHATGALARPETMQAHLDVDALALATNGVSMKALIPARIRLDQSVLHIEYLKLGGDLGGLSVEGQLNLHGALELELALADINLAKLGQFLNIEGHQEGILTGRIRLEGLASKPQISGQVRSTGVRWAGRALGNGRLDFTYAQRRITLEKLELNLPRGRLEAQGFFPIDLALEARQGVPEDAGYQLQVQLRDLIAGPELGLMQGLEIAANADLVLKGPARDWQQAQGQAAFSRLEIHTPQAVLANPRPLVLAIDDGALRIEDLELQVAFLQRPEAGGQAMVSGHLGLEDSKLHFHFADLALAAFDGLIPGLESLDGRVDLDVKLEGPLTNLQPIGFARLREGRGRIAGVGVELFFRAGEATIQPGYITLGGFEGKSRQGDWSLNGRIGLAGVRPDSLDLQLDLRGVDLTLANALNLRVVGALHWQGTLAASRLWGHLQAGSGRITRSLELNPLGRRPPPSPTQASPRLESVTLDVSLDLEQVQWRDVLLDVELAGAVAMKGTAARPRLDGRIETTRGKFYYLDHQLEIQRAAIMLVEPQALTGIFSLLGSLPELDPHIEIEAHGEIAALNGNEYLVELELQGPLSDLAFDLRSDPPRNRVELLALLNFGDPEILLADESGALLDRTARLSAGYMLQALERRFLQVLDLEQVRVDAGLFLQQGMAGTRITLTKKLNPKTEVTYSTAVGHAAEGRVQVNYQIVDFLYFQVERDPEGESGADLKLRLRFR